MDSFTHSTNVVWSFLIGLGFFGLLGLLAYALAKTLPESALEHDEMSERGNSAASDGS
jgi:hypothetical protein